MGNGGHKLGHSGKWGWEAHGNTRTVNTEQLICLPRTQPRASSRPIALEATTAPPTAVPPLTPSPPGLP